MLDCLLSIQYYFYPKRSYSQIHIFIFLCRFFLSVNFIQVRFWKWKWRTHFTLKHLWHFSWADMKSQRFPEFFPVFTWPCWLKLSGETSICLETLENHSSHQTLGSGPQTSGACFLTFNVCLLPMFLKVSDSWINPFLLMKNKVVLCFQENLK